MLLLNNYLSSHLNCNFYVFFRERNNQKSQGDSGGKLTQDREIESMKGE